MTRISQGLLVTVVAVIAAVVGGITVSSRGGSAPGPQAADVAVSCGAGYRAEIRQALTGGSPRVMLQCVPESMVPAAYAPVPMVPGVQGPATPMAQPVMYTAPGITRMTPADFAPTRPVSRTSRSVVRAGEKSSWKKHALVIGGSAGAGAGIGAIAGGKKGALIGAAIGGGSAALFEAIKN